jgi:uncharacterized membrane protein YuzA (DUF378 family)
MIAWGATFAALMWLAFIVAYWVSTGGNWRHNPYGRNAMAVSTVLFVIVARIAVVNHFPFLRENPYIGLVVYTATGLAAIWRILLLDQAQHDTMEAHEDKEKSE